MATINPSLIYVDGVTLDVDSHNSNAYTAYSGEGIMSEPNGGLEPVNLESGFTVRADHVWTEEVVRARQEGGVETLDYMDDAAGSTDSTYVGIPGLSARVYLPYAASHVLWQWSVFISAWNWRDESGAIIDASPGDIHIKAFLNGTALDHTRRVVPKSAFVNAVGAVKRGEPRSALHYDMSHLQVAAAGGQFHELSVQLNMDYIDRNRAIEVLFSGGVAGLADLRQRVSFGLRNIRVMTLL